MVKNQYIDRDNLYSDRMDADSGGEDFMGGQGAPNGGIAGLSPEIASAIAQLMSAQPPAPLTTTRATTEADNSEKPDARKALLIATKREPMDLRYDVNKDGKVTSADALSIAKGSPIRSDIDAFGAKPATTDVGSLSTTASAAPVAAYQAPTAQEMRDGVGKDGQVATLSQTQGYGMVPVYAQQGRMSERFDDFGQPLEPVLLGYEFNPIAAGLTTVDVPKPAAILAEEKRIGKEMEATYATFTEPMSGGDRGQRESIAYGPPTGYRYDDGQSQYVKFDSSGKYYETEKRKGEFDDALKAAALFTAIATGGAALGLGGAGASTAAAAFTPEMIAAGLTPGSIGAAGAASGALTGAELAAASGIGSLGAGAAGAAGLGASTPITETAAETLGNTASGAGGYGSGAANPSLLSSAGAGAAETSIGTLTNAAPSLNQLAASGMGPGSYGALNLPALEAAVAAGSIAPEALAAAQLAATGTAGAGITSLAPTLAKSANEAIASGMSPGSVGADLASKGLLTGEQLAAASGAAGTGITSLAPAAAKSVNEMIASGMSPGSAGATGAASGALTGAELAAATGTTGAGVASLAPVAAKSLNEGIASGTFTPGSVGADLASKGLLTGEQLAAAAGTTGAGITSIAPAAAKSVNEMIASGTGAGSAGAAGAASGALTPAQLAAASGAVTAGATPALVELANAGKGLPSANEAVASGLGPGSAGAKAAVEGTLTAQELAAAAGTAGALTKDGVGDLLTKAKDVVTDKAKDVLSGSGSGSGSGMGILGLMALMSMMNKGGGAAPASTATIPELTATRTQLPYDVDKKGVNPNTPYRPGQGGVTYFSPTTYTPTPPKAAGGGLMSLGQSNLGSYSDGGRLLKGPGDGVSDSIPAIIGRKQPARLANGEFVIPARIVSELGNGSTDAGAKRLYEMMARVQKARRNTKNVAANTKAAKYLPA